MQNEMKTVETVCHVNTPEDKANEFILYSHTILVSDNYAIRTL